MVTAAAVALIGGVAAGAAQAQVMPRHSSVSASPHATQQTSSVSTNTRDMGARAKPHTAAKPLDDTCTQIIGTGVNIRRTPWGTVIGTANSWDRVSDPIAWQQEPDGTFWVQLIDYTAGNTMGWIIGTYVSEDVPATFCH
jgi:hypothetical protein